MVELKIKNAGVIVIDLIPQVAPITAVNFKSLVEKGFYNGLTFHRVIPNFMIQGGDPNGNGTGGAGYCIYGEFAENGWPNPLSHKRGVVSMARSQDPNSASSQFFICQADSLYLDGQYAAFGVVKAGYEILDAIANYPRDEHDKPQDDIIIEEARWIDNDINLNECTLNTEGLNEETGGEASEGEPTEGEPTNRRLADQREAEEEKVEEE